MSNDKPFSTRGCANGFGSDARSPLASPLLPKAEANAKGEDSLSQDAPADARSSLPLR
ncbi:hypothetical protein [Nostoc sp.]|uniref:hypothetical protein n=1 Tax=Nostoc sp. TaxID=1180 RepID=UPI002FFC0AF3